MIKESKQKYFNNCFQNNVKGGKETWKIINSDISLKVKDSESPKITKTRNREKNTDPKLTADKFNNFLCSVVQSVQEKSNYAFKPFYNYLSKSCGDSFIITPCTEDEISRGHL